MATEPNSDVNKKLDAIRAAASHVYPTADIGEMLSEIERGYGDATLDRLVMTPPRDPEEP